MSKRKLTYEDFKRYFFNRQKPEEKHHFEKEMMQDAFDEEAFDGLSMLSEEEFEQDIDKLKNRIQERTQKRKRTVYLYVRYAAGIAIILGLGLSTLYFFDRNMKRDITDSKPMSESMALRDSAPANEEKEALKKEMAETTAEKKKSASPELSTTQKELPKKIINELTIIDQDDDSYDINEFISESDNELEIAAEEKNNIAVENKQSEQEKLLAVEELKVAESTPKELETKSKAQPVEKETPENNKHKRLFEKSNRKNAKREIAVAADEALSGNAMPQSKGYTALEDRDATPPNNWNMDTLENRLIKEIKKRSDLADKTYKVEMILTIDTQGQIASVTHKKEVPENLKLLIKNTLRDMGNWQPAIENGQVTSSEITLKFKLKQK